MKVTINFKKENSELKGEIAKNLLHNLEMVKHILNEIRACLVEQ